jgi:Fur family ferric uptake transcriptional regulator
MTRAQRAVLAALTGHDTFVSAQDLHARIRATGETVGLTSVYRALQSLAEAGQVDVRRTDAGEATYRACGSDRHHHHLVCTGCGATVEVEAPALERWVGQVADRHGYRIDGHTLEISGRCRGCAGG